MNQPANIFETNYTELREDVLSHLYEEAKNEEQKTAVSVQEKRANIGLQMRKQQLEQAKFAQDGQQQRAQHQPDSHIFHYTFLGLRSSFSITSPLPLYLP